MLRKIMKNRKVLTAFLGTIIVTCFMYQQIYMKLSEDGYVLKYFLNQHLDEHFHKNTPKYDISLPLEHHRIPGRHGIHRHKIDHDDDLSEHFQQLNEIEYDSQAESEGAIDGTTDNGSNFEQQADTAKISIDYSDNLREPRKVRSVSMQLGEHNDDESQEEQAVKFEPEPTTDIPGPLAKVVQTSKRKEENKNGHFNCPFIKFTDKKKLEDIKPYLSTIRRDHYLVATMPFGPNNQLRGFRDSIILAIYLNRTIVMPPFFKHRSDPSYVLTEKEVQNYQGANEKVDIFKLAEFVPVITLDEFGKRCKDGLDVIFLAREDSDQRILSSRRAKALQDYTGIKIFEKFEKNNNVYTAPTVINKGSIQKKLKNSGTKAEARIEMNRKKALEVYGPDVTNSNDGSCALYMEPYRNVLFDDFIVRLKASNSPPPEDLNPYELASRVIRDTARPSSVRHIKESFIKDIMGVEDDYAAMHWRYDFKDFGEYCRRNLGKSSSKTRNMGLNALCGSIKGDPVKIGQNIEKEIEIFNRETKSRVKKLYVATPPIMKDFIAKMSEGMKKVQLFQGDSLTSFINSSHEGCPSQDMELRRHDFQSLVEMELCSKSAFFLSSNASSWSGNIIQEREVFGFDVRDQPNTVLFEHRFKLIV